MKSAGILRATFVSSALAFSLHSATLQAQSLYAQSVQTALVHTLPDAEFVLLDLRTHETLANTFAEPAKPIPAGSLLKPFVALAYAASHDGPNPTIVCHGHPDRCWKAHGTMTLTSAIAQSCNAFFLSLAHEVSSPLPYLPPTPAKADAATLMGLTPDWLIAPQAIVNAYADLLAAPPTSTSQQIIAAMRASALYGTASHIGHHPGGVLAKTGTATCIDTHCSASGDGLVVAAVPASHPTLLLLVRRRGTTGAMTAASASRLLTRLETLHAE